MPEGYALYTWCTSLALQVIAVFAVFANFAVFAVFASVFACIGWFAKIDAE